jgi:hypothetical protein
MLVAYPTPILHSDGKSGNLTILAHENSSHDRGVYIRRRTLWSQPIGIKKREAKHVRTPTLVGMTFDPPVIRLLEFSTRCVLS